MWMEECKNVLEEWVFNLGEGLIAANYPLYDMLV